MAILSGGGDDVSHEICGTEFNKDVVKAEKNQPLELWLRLVIKPQTNYEFFEFEHAGKRLVLLEIEAAYRQPVTALGGGWARIGNAMVDLKMIDTLGSGIRRMFMKQRERFMPMPDYQIDDEVVTVNIPGRILDARYCGMLMRDANLTLQEIVLLDRLQKGIKLDKETVKFLRKRGLVEGRVKNLMIAARVADETGQKAEYMNAANLRCV